ncbi:hypothetical protein [Duganella sp. HH101]|uniref:hypothetical protein n=1 Tax=Duganella sp. HH101 TaxID=1781066 RepID=UPI000875034B|nr:hypothetical protein [Duganella sp. HH101]OFA05163.1 hypothetical protein DUGA2_19110 [Duganella sp. HH101]
MSITNHEGLRVVLRPGQLPNTYEFVVENNGDLVLWDVQLSGTFCISEGGGQRWGLLADFVTGPLA